MGFTLYDLSYAKGGKDTLIRLVEDDSNEELFAGDICDLPEKYEDCEINTWSMTINDDNQPVMNVYIDYEAEEEDKDDED